MRLDSHTHMYHDTLQKWIEILPTVHATHFVAIMMDDAMDMAARLDETGIKGLPFHWLDLSRADPYSKIPVAGYKIHLRFTEPRNGKPVYAIKEHIGNVCENAAKEHRPMLFHTDGDDPNPSSVSMLAQLCRDFPSTTMIAGHMGVYTQERYETQYQAEVFEPMLLNLWKMNIRHILDTPNLYGDITKFGMDYTWRARDPMARFRTFKTAVQELDPVEKKALVDKLFVGTDFPHFWRPDEDQSSCLSDKTIVPSTHLDFQIKCMKEVFGDLFDEERMARNFLSLLPEAFRDK